MTSALTNEGNRRPVAETKCRTQVVRVDHAVRPHGAQRRRSHLSDLDFGWDLWIHQRGATVGMNHLPRDPSGLVRAEKSNDIPHVRWCSQAPQRGPSAGVPIPNEGLDLLRQTVQDAIFRPPRAYGIPRFATATAK